MRKIYRLFCVLPLFFATGCGSIKHEYNALFDTYQANHPAAEVVTAQESKHQATIQATQESLQADNITQAKVLLTDLKKKPLSAPIKEEKDLLEIQVDMKSHRLKQALRHVNRKLLNTQNNEAMRLALLKTKHEILSRMDKPYTRVRTALTLNESCDSAECRIPPQMLWKDLEDVPLKKLVYALKHSNSAYERGWISLAVTSKEYKGNPSLLADSLQLWKEQNPEHEGRALLPDTLNPEVSHKKIAVLLPLKGDFAPLGKAIRSGIMTSYFTLPTDEQRNVKLSFYNTATKEGVGAVYQNAINNGADFVIGPLLKENVNLLASEGNLPVPTLALNYPNTDSAIDNLYSFGLSPENEGIQLADLAWETDHQRALLIVSDGPGKLTDTIVSQWTARGGQILEQVSIENGKEVAPVLASLLHVDESQERIKALRQTLGGYMKANPTRRHDFDVIFLVANPKMTKQIIPMLKFYFAGNVPIIASSWSYRHFSPTKYHHEMNGVIYTDVPLVLDETMLAKTPVENMGPFWRGRSNEYRRLYAVGMDALMLSQRIPLMQVLPNFPQAGKTGLLHMNENHRIYARLTHAIILNGHAHEYHQA